MSFERLNYGTLPPVCRHNCECADQSAAMEVAKDNISVNSLAYTAQ